MNNDIGYVFDLNFSLKLSKFTWFFQTKIFFRSKFFFEKVYFKIYFKKIDKEKELNMILTVNRIITILKNTFSNYKAD